MQIRCFLSQVSSSIRHIGLGLVPPNGVINTAVVSVASVENKVPEPSPEIKKVISTPVALPEELEELSATIKASMRVDDLKAAQKNEFKQKRDQLLTKYKIQQHDVVIVGAGPAGLMNALEYARKGHSVCLLEKRTSETWDVRSNALVINHLTLKRIVKELELLKSSQFVKDDFVFSHAPKQDKDHHKSLSHLYGLFQKGVYV